MSKKLNTKMRFENTPRRPGKRSFVEQLLSEKAASNRIPDQYTAQREGQGAGIGLHINFVLSNDGDYAVLMTRKKKCVFLVNAQNDEHLRGLQADIDANGLGHKFDVEQMPPTKPHPLP